LFGKYNHATLVLEFKVDPSVLGQSAFPFRKRKRETPILPDESDLNKQLLIETMTSGKDESKKRWLSSIPFCLQPTIVTICGGSKNTGKHTASAGAAVFFGLDSGLNRHVREQRKNGPKTAGSKCREVGTVLVQCIAALHRLSDVKKSAQFLRLEADLDEASDSGDASLDTSSRLEGL
jgi:hypothetical protein